jgi:hypothetical protein
MVAPLPADPNLGGFQRHSHFPLRLFYGRYTIIRIWIPELFTGCPPSLTAFCHWLQVAIALPILREIGALHVGFLPHRSNSGPPLAQTVNPKGVTNTEWGHIRC